jgi:hypothetical protein
MAARILLVHPPIYDFTAYDFWLRPFGLLRVAGRLRGLAEMELFDFLDRHHPAAGAGKKLRSDEWGRGEFPSEVVEKPAALAGVPRRYRRYGLGRETFRAFLAGRRPFDFALVAATMTYWYPGVREVIGEVRKLSPGTKIALGGTYPTLCAEHARSLGADLVVCGLELAALWRFLELSGDPSQRPLWEACEDLPVGVLKLTEGCPFRCSYCSVPQVYGSFRARPPDEALCELDMLVARGARDVAFYDDALLHEPDAALKPFLLGAVERSADVSFHTPNGLNARMVTPELAELMVRAGFRTFYLGFESAADGWQERTGGKLRRGDLSRAVGHLTAAGAARERITAYIILGHPDADRQAIEASMRYVQGLGIRTMLSEFSPVPGTPDGERSRRWADLDEPLWHNKTAFAWARLGERRVEHLKQLCRELNAGLRGNSPRG